MTKMAGHVLNALKCLERARMAGHGGKWLELDRIAINGYTWQEMTGNGWKYLEMPRNGWNGWIWLEMAGIDWNC